MVAIAELVVHAHLDNVELGAAFAAVAYTREMVVGAQIDVGVFQTKREVIAQGALYTQTGGPADMTCVSSLLNPMNPSWTSPQATPPKP